MKILAVLLLKWNYIKHNTFLANVFSCFSHICLYFFFFSMALGYLHVAVLASQNIWPSISKHILLL